MLENVQDPDSPWIDGLTITGIMSPEMFGGPIGVNNSEIDGIHLK
jgi:hypothetical protein